MHIEKREEREREQQREKRITKREREQERMNNKEKHECVTISLFTHSADAIIIIIISLSLLPYLFILDLTLLSSLKQTPFINSFPHTFPFSASPFTSATDLEHSRNERPALKFALEPYLPSGYACSKFCLPIIFLFVVILCICSCFVIWIYDHFFVRSPITIFLSFL